MKARRLLRMVWQLGLPWAFLFGAWAAFFLNAPLYAPSQSTAVNVWKFGLAELPLIVFAAWGLIGRYHARLAFSAIDLCLPGVLRLLCVSLLAQAVLTLGGLISMVVARQGPWHSELVSLVDAMLLGLLMSLRPNIWWRLACLAVVASFVYAGLPRPGNPAFPWFGWPFAMALALLLAWRGRKIFHLLRSDSTSPGLRHLMMRPGSEFDLNSLSGNWDWLLRRLEAAWRVLASPMGAHSSLERRSVQCANAQSLPEAINVALGPLYQKRSMTPWLLGSAVLAAYPWYNWWGRSSALALCDPGAPSYANRVLDLRLATSVTLNFMAFALPLVAMYYIARRVGRLGDLFGKHGGEMADLALLPGLGDERVRRMALLREALLRPLLRYGLWIGGWAGSWLVLAWLVRAGLPQYLYLALSAGSMVLLYATIGMGVLGGALAAARRWYDWLSYPVVILSCITGAWVFVHPFLSPVRNLPLWLNLTWAVVLLSAAACLVWWSVRFYRLRNPFCR